MVVRIDPSMPSPIRGQAARAKLPLLLKGGIHEPDFIIWRQPQVLLRLKQDRIAQF